MRKDITIDEGEEIVQILIKSYSYHYQQSEFEIDFPKSIEGLQRLNKRAKEKIVEDADSFFSVTTLWNLNNNAKNTRGFRLEILKKIYYIIVLYSGSTFVEETTPSDKISNISTEEKNRAKFILLDEHTNENDTTVAIDKEEEVEETNELESEDSFENSLDNNILQLQEPSSAENIVNTNETVDYDGSENNPETSRKMTRDWHAIQTFLNIRQYEKSWFEKYRTLIFYILICIFSFVPIIHWVLLSCGLYMTLNHVIGWKIKFFRILFLGFAIFIPWTVNYATGWDYNDEIISEIGSFDKHPNGIGEGFLRVGPYNSEFKNSQKNIKVELASSNKIFNLTLFIDFKNNGDEDIIGAVVYFEKFYNERTKQLHLIAVLQHGLYQRKILRDTVNIFNAGRYAELMPCYGNIQSVDIDTIVTSCLGNRYALPVSTNLFSEKYALGYVSAEQKGLCSWGRLILPLGITSQTEY